MLNVVAQNINIIFTPKLKNQKIIFSILVKN